MAILFALVCTVLFVLTRDDVYGIVANIYIAAYLVSGSR